MTEHSPPLWVKIGGAAMVCATGAWWLRHLSARAVRQWKPGAGRFVRAGKLVVRTAGTGGSTVLLLHGLVSSGETFGSAYDPLAELGTLLVPDLLGFSRSMNWDTKNFSLAAHLDALDEMVDALGLASSRFLVGGHSLGGLLALLWAARRVGQVDAVVTWGAPLFRDEKEGREQLEQMGALERLFAKDSRLAARSCELMCAHRNLASLLAIALCPDLPVPVSRRAVLHTWPAYRGGIEILFSDWPRALRRLADYDVPVRLAAGTGDRSQVPGLNERLAREYENVRAIEIGDAKHIVVLTHGRICAEQLIAANAAGR